MFSFSSSSFSISLSFPFSPSPPSTACIYKVNPTHAEVFPGVLCWRAEELGGGGLKPADKLAETKSCLPGLRASLSTTHKRRFTMQKVNKRKINLDLPEETRHHRPRGCLSSSLQGSQLRSVSFAERKCIVVWPHARPHSAKRMARRNWREAAGRLQSFLRALRLPATFHRSIFAGRIGFSKHCSPHTRLTPAGNRSCVVWNLLSEVMAQHKAGHVTIILLETPTPTHTFTPSHP